MSVLQKIEQLNEECVVCLPSEGDELLYMPLCGITHCRDDYFIRRDVSIEYGLEYVVSGKGTFRVGNQSYAPEAGDIYITQRGSTHFYRTDPLDCWVKIWFNIRGRLMDSLMSLYGLKGISYIPQVGPRAERLFRECLEIMQANRDQAHEHATLVAHKLVFGISDMMHSRDEKEINPIALTLRKCLEQQVAKRLSLGELSSRFGYSVSQLNRLFQHEYNCSIYQYFLQRKLELAAIMLQNTSKNIREIADELSFSDPYYFSNLFKRKYGKSPKMFRAKGSPLAVSSLQA